MANTKISNLPSINVPVNDSVIPIVQSGVTSKISYLDLKNSIGGGGGSSDLATTLGIGNTTGGNNITLTSGDLINSSSGDSIFNLRAAATDSFWFLGNDASGGALTGPFGSIVYGNATEAALLYNVTRYGVIVNNDGLVVGGTDPSSPSAHTKIQGGGIVIENDASLLSPTDPVQAVIGVIYNNGTDRNFTTVGGAAAAVGINSGRSAGPLSPTTVNDGVVRSVAVGGAGLTLKTDDTAYMNQISLQPDGNTFDGLIQPPALTADRLYLLPDNSGPISITAVKPITFASSPFVAINGDTVIGDTTGGPISVVLQAVSFDGQKVSVKNIPGTVNNITVTVAGGQIDGAANATILPGQALTFVSEGSDYWIIGSY